ncbi:MAG: PKD domain-containing protein, partial [Bacteroidota bacterium]
VRDVNGCENSQTVDVAAFTTALNASIIARQDASCGENNGAFTVSVANGTTPYTFDIGEGESTDSTFTNLAFGTYEITVTDANACSTVIDVRVDQGADSVTGEVVQNISATCGQSNGSLTVQATSGVAPFTYDIGLGASATPLFMNLSQGIYDITITDVNGCQGTIEAILEESNPITADVSNLQNASCGEDNGQFQVVVNSGIAPFTYDIGDGGTTNPMFTGLAGGTYVVTITDVNFCATSLQVSIDQNPPLRAEVEDLENTACGEDNGAFTINPLGGTAPYQFDIGNGLSENNRFENLTAGIYEVSIVDSEGCESVQDVEVGTSSPIEASLIGPTVATCGEANATLAVVVENGVAPIRYDIGQGTTSDPNFSDLAAGTYTVTITDARNCTATLAAVVEASSGITFSIRKEDDFCGNGEGIVTVVPSGGTTPYTYDIGEGASADNTFEGLFPGEYEITVTDATGCESIASTTVRATSDLNVALLSQRRPTCGESNGRIVVSAGSGVAPYRFDIGNGDVSNSTFENLAPGQYEVTITDAVDCQATVMIDLPTESEPPVATITANTAVSCAGNDGSFRVEANGGLAPYTYTIGGSASTNPDFEDLSAGNYVVTITDANGCFTTAAVEIEGTTNLVASIENLANENCEAANGSFEVAVNGGTPPYRYNIGNGFTDNATITGLSSGSYILTVVDARNCETTQSISIESINDLRASVGGEVAASCTEENGAFTVLPTGGTAPYRYSIGEGFTASPRFEGLARGNYEITVTDANDCNFYLRTEVVGTAAPEISIFNKEDASCGKNDGSINLLATGGQSPYTYDIGNGASTSNRFNNLADGSYEATVTDANGCSASILFNIAMIGSLPSTSFVVDTSELVVQLRNTSSAFDSLIWEVGDGSVYTTSSVNHEYADEGTYTICLTTINSCGSDTQCQAIAVESSVKKADLAGLVTTELDMPVGNVNMLSSNADSTWTDADGLYSLRLFRDSSYTITPTKNIDLLAGVSTYDIFLINNHILAKERLDSPYKIIAADVNNSGSITTFDVVMLRKLLLGISDELPNGNTSWRFVDAAYQFPDPENPFMEKFPEAIDVNLENSINSVNFIGVKIGDVNNSIDGEDDEDANGIEGRESHTKQIVAQWSADRSEIIVSAPAAIAGLQFTLAFDPTQLSVTALVPANLEDLSLQNFGLQQFESGKISLSWHGNQLIHTAAELFRLKVKNPASIDLAKVLELDAATISAEAFDFRNLYDLDLSITEPNELVLHGNAPNPFDEWTQIYFDLPQASEVLLSLYDGKGGLIRQEKHQLAAGEQSIVLARQNLPAGIVYYRLENGQQVVSGKMVLME